MPVAETLNGVEFDSSGEVGGKLGYWFNGVSATVAAGIGVDAFYFKPIIGPQTVNATASAGNVGHLCEYNKYYILGYFYSYDAVNLRMF